MSSKELTADSFKNKFIESYIGDVSVEESSEKKRIVNLRRTTAASIADDIISTTNNMVKTNDLDNSNFAFAILYENIQREGYNKLLDSNGNININHIKAILNKDIKKQIEINGMQKNETQEQVLDKFIQTNKMTEEEVKTNLGKMDFSKLAIDDIVMIEENIDYAVKNMTEEQIEAFNEEICKGQDESVKKDNEAILNAINKMKNGKGLSEEEEINCMRIAKERGFDNLEELFKETEKEYNDDAKVSLQIRTEVLEHAQENNGEIKQDFIDRIAQKYSNPKYKNSSKALAWDMTKKINSHIYKVIEEAKDIGIKIPEKFMENVYKNDQVAQKEDLQYEDEKIEFKNFYTKNDVNKNSWFGSNDFLEDYVQENNGEIDQNFVNKKEEFNKKTGDEIKSEDMIQDLFDKNSEDTIQKMFDNFFDFEMNAVIDYFKNTFLKEDVLEESKENFVEQENNNDIKDEYEVPQFEEKKSLIEKMQESKNPFARTIAKGLMKITGKTAKALPEPQKQQEGAAKPRNYDSNGVGFDITDSDLFPSKRMALKNTFRKLFNFKNNNIKENEPVQTIKPITSSDFDKRIKLSQNQMNEVKVDAPIIPKKQDIIKDNVINTKESKDDGFEK